MSKRLLSLAAVLLCFPVLITCGSQTTKQESLSQGHLENLPYPGGIGPQWVYNGPFVRPLERAELIVSIAGHTARVTGLLPIDFNLSTLPYYAIPEREGLRTRVTIVYPISTADTRTSPNSQPGVFRSVYAFGRKTLNEIAEWGGFPFIVYNGGIGLHGPITAHGNNGREWQLMRGRVSHGCNRMQGEHAVELAHLLGTNMRTRVWGIDEFAGTLNVSVRVLPEGIYDTHKGKVVDVNYPVFNAPGLPKAIRPVPNANRDVQVYPTWDARELSRYVCRYSRTSGLGDSRCDHQPPNRIDPRTGGRPLGAIECPSGFALRTVGTAGGRVCVGPLGILGPFTSVMFQKCLAWGGGDAACASNIWDERLALSARGVDLCPDGASFDTTTGYCAEGIHAFGPFPKALVNECVAQAGGPACFSARWDKDFLASLLRLK